MSMKIFTTSDLGLVAALATFGMIHKDTQTFSPTKVTFIYEDTDILKKARDSYSAGLLQGNLSTYYNNLKSYKSNIYEILRQAKESEPLS